MRLTTTTTACPDWCTLDHDRVERDGENHSRALCTVPLLRNGSLLYVDVSRSELGTDVALSLDVPGGGENVRLSYSAETVDKLRDLAQSLLAAAEDLEDVLRDDPPAPRVTTYISVWAAAHRLDRTPVEVMLLCTSGDLDHFKDDNGAVQVELGSVEEYRDLIAASKSARAT